MIMRPSDKAEGPSKNPLVVKAMAHSIPVTGPKGRHWTNDELELFILWFRGMLRATQVLKALGLRGSVLAYAATALKQAIATGHVDLVIKENN